MRAPVVPLLLSLATNAGGAALAAERPSVVLVTLDTTRADRMGFLGSKAGLTTALDRLAARSVVFEHAYAQAPLTTVSHATILSGTYPQFHKVNDFGVPLPPDLPYLPDLLKAAGWRTAAFLGSLVLDARSGLAPGFDRGFDVYDAGFRTRRGKESRYETIERRGAEVVDHALAWLARRPPGPFLLWVHLYDPHDPYEAPAPFGPRFAREPYDGEVAYVDAQVGRLMAELEKQKLLDRALVAVFGDHGESRGEHGEKTHGVFLYDATIHVPLLVKLPGPQAAGRRVGTRVRLVDLAPTVLEALGIPVPPATQGESLLRLLNAPKAADRPAYAETDYPRRAFGWGPLAAWRADRFLYVKAPRPELYDLRVDPGQKRDIAGDRTIVLERIAAQMAEFQRRTGGEAGDSPGRSLDPALLERLAALGYVSSGAVAPLAGAGLDPKDKVAVANDLHDAIVHVESGDVASAVPLLEKVTESDPQIPMAQIQLGVARSRLRQHARAIPALRKGIALQPDAMNAHYEMGLALFETGDWKTSAGHFEIVASRMPKFADARFSLGSVYARIDRVPDAMKELRTALDLEPSHYRANLLLGRLLTLLGRPAEGVPYLEQAATVEPGSSEAPAFLGDAYERLGRTADAAQARLRAERLRKPGPP